MLIRIVKMTFKSDKTEAFLAVFNHYRSQIRAAEGCTHLELLQDINNANVFTTFSKWKDETHLDLYRKSLLFKNVWAKTKVLFAEKAEAVSYRVIDKK